MQSTTMQKSVLLMLLLFTTTTTIYAWTSSHHHHHHHHCGIGWSSRSADVPSHVRSLSSLRSSSSSSSSSSNINTTTYSNSVQSFKDQEEFSYNEGSVNVRIVDSNNIDTISAAATTAATHETACTSLVDKIVIVLNTNSGGVTYDLVNTANDLIREITKTTTTSNIDVRLLVTSTWDDAQIAAKGIINDIAYPSSSSTSSPKKNSKPTLIIPIGGDGTLTSIINLLWKEQQNNNNEDFPFIFGYIAMGTGNALGTVVGCSPQQQQQQVVTTTKRIRSGRKRKFIKSLFRNPQKRKQDNFKIVLKQLIEATTATTTKSSLDTDIIDLPLIRVRTTKSKTGVTNGNNDNSIDGDNDNDNDEDEDDDDDQYAFFAGVGYDSLLLQDYKDLQKWTKKKEKNSDHNLLPRPRFLTTGVLGYTVAMLTRSIPKLIQLQDPSKLLRDVRITTTKSYVKSTSWIDHRRGDIIRPIESESSKRSIIFNNNDEEENTNENDDDEEILLYRGSAGIIAGSTVPYYGGKLKLFPFARISDNKSMQLRIARQLHPMEGLSKVMSIFNGSYRDSSSSTFKCLDFVGTKFIIEINESYSTSTSTSTRNGNAQQTEEGFPVQHSGESVGRCTRIEFVTASSNNKRLSSSSSSYSSLPPPPIRFVTLISPRLVTERLDLDS
jgi:hypothetical protein